MMFLTDFVRMTVGLLRCNEFAYTAKEFRDLILVTFDSAFLFGAFSFDCFVIPMAQIQVDISFSVALFAFKCTLKRII
jgi:hypothetical protein